MNPVSYFPAVTEGFIPDSSADPGAPVWKMLTTLTATVVIMAGLLFALFWSVVHCRPESCKKYFQKKPLPQALVSAAVTYTNMEAQK